MSAHKIDDGGPAFPFPSGPEPRENTFHDRSEGMTLRDYFAAKAMQAMIATYRLTDSADNDCDPTANYVQHTFHRDLAIDGGEGCDEIASDAYWFADAMLAARKEVPK